MHLLYYNPHEVVIISGFEDKNQVSKSVRNLFIVTQSIKVKELGFNSRSV